jgi:threonine/homoserine/homoserine lactone efflux protein
MNITFFLFYCLLVTITPGPTNIIILSTLHNNGIKKTLEFCYGAILSFGIVLVLSVLLNSFLTTFLPNILFFMQIIGSVYMLYLAYLIFNMHSTPSNKKEFGNFKIGFFMQFINPKILIFSLTLFPSFVMPYYSSIYQLVGFAFIVTFIGGVSLFSWILFGSLLKTFLNKYQRFVNVFMSLFLVYCAYVISGIEKFI